MSDLKNNAASSAKHALKPWQRKSIIAGVLTVVIALGYWWYTKLEWEEKEIDRGYSKEARLNDFLAAEIFLRKHGIPTTTVKNLSLLDTHSWRNLTLGERDTVVIINGYKTLTQERYDALYEWVEAGGTLVTSTQNPFIGTHTSAEDVLLSDFNIELEPEKHDDDNRNIFEKIADDLDKKDKEQDEEPTTENRAADDAGSETPADEDSHTKNQDGKPDTRSNHENPEPEERPDNTYRCALKETPTPIQFGSEQKPLDFDFSRRAPFIYYDYVAHENDADEPSSESLQEGASAAADEKNYHYDEKRGHLLYFDVGAGSITITSDNTIWSNQRIDCHDHAYGLWQLVNPDGRVWILINQDAPSLAALLWRNAPYGVIAGLIALLLWLWALGARFGPILVIEQTGRRSLAEHIYASAMLLWRKQQHPQLLTLLRKEILDRLNEQHPQQQATSNDQTIEFLYHLTGIAQTDIKQALFTDDLHQPQEFANAIAHLQTIRKQL